MPSLKPAQLERRHLNRRRCRKAAAQLAAEKTKEEKLQDEAAKRRAAAKAFSERTRRQHNAKLRERRGPPNGIKKKIDEERGEQLHAAVTLLEDSARLANRAREIVGAAPSHEERVLSSEAAFAAAVAAAKAGAALGIAREYCWSVAMAAFAMRRQQRLGKIQAWKARRGRVAQVPEEKIPQPDEEEQDQRLTISTRILHLPRYLCFSVVRFTPSIGNDSGFEKSNVAVDATKTLSLGDAFGDTAHASAKAELISVASHHGMSCGTGHWTTTWSMPGQFTTLGGLPTKRKQRRQPAKKRRQQAKQAKQQSTLFLYRTSGQL